jgi:hypothetical protein
MDNIQVIGILLVSGALLFPGEGAAVRGHDVSKGGKKSLFAFESYLRYGPN